MWRCPLCGVRFRSLAALVKHFASRHAASADRCPCCGRASRNMYMHAVIRACMDSDPCHALLYYSLTSTRKSKMLSCVRSVLRALSEPEPLKDVEHEVVDGHADSKRKDGGG